MCAYAVCIMMNGKNHDTPFGNWDQVIFQNYDIVEYFVRSFVLIQKNHPESFRDESICQPGFFALPAK